ncbi:MAG TPA: hypothetical protein VGO47_03445, partial [Chlamydiales bacterium]|nr:hypothetical protein [Chlamydiales bacterium]
EAVPAQRPPTVPMMPSYPFREILSLSAESLPQTSGNDQEKLQESQGGTIEPSTNNGWKKGIKRPWVRFLAKPTSGIQVPTAGYNSSASPNNSNYDSIPSPNTPKPAGIFTTTTTETPSPCNQAQRSTNNHRDSVNREPFEKTSRFCLDGLVCEKSKFVIACGGFSDVWKGKVKVKMEMKRDGDGSATSSCSDDTDGAAQVEQDVAIKVLRGFNSVGKSFAQAKMLKVRADFSLFLLYSWS